MLRIRFVPVLYALTLLTSSGRAQAPVKGPLTDHFVNWLIVNGYEGDSFERPDIGPNGSYGGKANSATQVLGA